jgi:hypothetical protein
VGALVRGIGQQAGRRVQLLVHAGRFTDVDAGPRGGHLLPDALDDGCEFGTGRTGYDDDVSVGRSGRHGPTTAGNRRFNGQPDCRAADGRNDKHVRTPGRGAEEPSGQVHRKAPSRHA